MTTARMPTKCCAQCGRMGTRGFQTIPQATHPPTGAVVGPFTICANSNACRRRWPKVLKDDE